MACIAAIKATRAVLQPIALSPAEIWIRIKWWCPETIEEALLTLVGSHECVTEVLSTGVRGYRRSPQGQPPTLQSSQEKARERSMLLSHRQQNG